MGSVAPTGVFTSSDEDQAVFVMYCSGQGDPGTRVWKQTLGKEGLFDEPSDGLLFLCKRRTCPEKG